MLADIPGLIEGAAEGKGLGHEFLRHISRTKILIHCIAADTVEPLVAYHTVRAELDAHGGDLVGKPELVLITKSDTVTPERLSELKDLFSTVVAHVRTATVLEDSSVKETSDAIVQFIQKSV